MKFLKLLALASVVLAGCNHVEIPKERYYQFYTDARIYFKDDSLCIYLNNPVSCPLRYYVSSSDTALEKKLNSLKLITLRQKSDTIFKLAADRRALETVKYHNVLGDLNQKIVVDEISLPFQANRKYKIIQGYNGRYSHSIDDYSRYSIDFNLSTNDTICAADDGIVVGAIKDYKYGDDDPVLRPYANLITLYHPHSGLFTQYLHLKYNGTLVTLGDSVKSGQPIGISGETGFTDREHLHFSALVPADTRDGLRSVKTVFIEGYKGEDLEKGDIVKK